VWSPVWLEMDLERWISQDDQSTSAEAVLEVAQGDRGQSYRSFEVSGSRKCPSVVGLA